MLHKYFKEEGDVKDGELPEFKGEKGELLPYRILSELNVEGKTKTTRAKLMSKGFDFEFFTSILNTKTGNTYYFLYDQGYMILENDYYMLVKKDI